MELYIVLKKDGVYLRLLGIYIDESSAREEAYHQADKYFPCRIVKINGELIMETTGK